MSIPDTEWGDKHRELKKIVEIADSTRFVIVHCAEGYHNHGDPWEEERFSG